MGGGGVEGVGGEGGNGPVLRQSDTHLDTTATSSGTLLLVSDMRLAGWCLVIGTLLSARAAELNAPVVAPAVGVVPAVAAAGVAAVPQQLQAVQPQVPAVGGGAAAVAAPAAAAAPASVDGNGKGLVAGRTIAD